MVFCPSSDPLTVITGGHNKASTSWGEWDPRTVENALDGLEASVRKLGDGAAQVGWTPFFCHS